MTGEREYVMGYPSRNPEDPEDYVPYPHYVLVPASSPTLRSGRSCVTWAICRLMMIALIIVSLGGTVYLLLPMDPIVHVQHISLEKLDISTDDTSYSILPSVHLDVILALQLEITNPNFFSVTYDNVTVYIFYHGDKLGQVDSQGGDVPRRSVSMATATLDLESTELLDHATDLVSDVANGRVPLQTVTKFSGAIEMWFLKPSINMNVICDIVVDPKEKEVTDKDCSVAFSQYLP